MRVTVEYCTGGYLLEVQDDRPDSSFCIMPGHTDYKMVAVTYAEVEHLLRELFQGKNYEAQIEDHGAKPG